MAIVWFTGLSGSGKSTIARAAQEELLRRGIPVEVLDGDVIRHTFSRGLGFSKQDRDENVRRVGYVASLLARHGVVVLVALISPYRAVRNEVRQEMESASIQYLEVYVNAPLDVCRLRDPKGLYRDKIPLFTGVDDPYEAPLAPDVECRTDQESVEASTLRVIEALTALKARSTRA